MSYTLGYESSVELLSSVLRKRIIDTPGRPDRGAFVIYRLRYADSPFSYLKLDVIVCHPILVFWVKNNQCVFSWFNLSILLLAQVLISAMQTFRLFETPNQVSFDSIAI